MQSLRQQNSPEIASVRGKKNNSLTGKKQNAKPSKQPIVQPKLELTQPGDRYEQEADRMADFVMRKQFDNAVMPSTTSVLLPVISRNMDTSSGVAIDTATENGINASRGGGQALPDSLRSQMESGFGADFSNVRLHTDSRAAQLSQNINAKAFTYGNDIYFNRGQYNPTSNSGQHLIAHELTHVVQQNGKVGRWPDFVIEKMLLQKQLKKMEDIAILLKDCTTYTFLKSYMPSLIPVGEKFVFSLTQKDMEKAQKKLNKLRKNHEKTQLNSQKATQRLNSSNPGVYVKGHTKYGASHIEVNPLEAGIFQNDEIKAEKAKKAVALEKSEIAMVEKEINRLLKIKRCLKITFFVVDKALTIREAADLIYNYHRMQHENWSKSKEMDLYADTIFFVIGFGGLPGAIASATLSNLYHSCTDWLENGGDQKLVKASLNFLDQLGGGLWIGGQHISLSDLINY